MVQEAKDRFRYACDLDVGDVHCQYTTEAEDMAQVRAEAAMHRVSDHHLEDMDPSALDALIEMQRVEA